MFTKQEIEVCKQVPSALKILSGEKWEWKPEVGEWFLSPLLSPHMVNEGEELAPDYKRKCIPLLHWEKLETELSNLGYSYAEIDLENGLWEFQIDDGHDYIFAATGKTRQEAVCKAILELVKEK